MLKKLFAGAAVALALVASPACAQPAPGAATVDADPALWVVKDADTTVYLFGTVHVLKPGLSWFDEAVKAAFDKSDTLVVELVQPDPATMQKIVLAKGINPTGPTLTEKLPADKRVVVAKALADVGLPQAAYDRMDPWLAAVTVTLAPLQKLGYEAGSGAEKVLESAAKSAGKQVVGLETAEQQLGFFDALSTASQVAFLVEGVEELPRMGAMMDSMVGSWAKGDPDALARLLNDNMRETPELNEALLVKRNRTWAGWIAERMRKPGTVFVAVGAGHLAGADAVQAQLAKRGIKSERVRY